MQKNRGISLIVLVITIIVMIILAGSIVLTLNNSGIIDRASEAVEQTNLANVKEFAQTAWAEAYMNGAKTDDEFQEAVETALEKNKIDVAQYTIKATTNGVEVTLKVIEKIGITTSEQMYALSRLLTSDVVRTSYLPNYTTDGSMQNDLAMFDYPEDVTTDDEKIEYLMTTSYKLENDIELKLLKSSYISNFSIGSDDRPFKGYFNGNNKTITITEYDATKRETFNGIFGRVDGATIINTNVELANDINMIQGLISTNNGNNIGFLVSNMNNTKLKNNHVRFNGKTAKFVFDNASVKRSLPIGGIVGLVTGNSTINSCSFSMENNSEILISNTNDSDEIDYWFGCIVAKIVNDYGERTEISNCKVSLNGSNINMITPKIGCSGGIVGRAERTTIIDTQVVFTNSSMGINAVGDSYSTANLYYSLATGGIIGFSSAGSANDDETIGKEGNIVKKCSFSATNANQMEVLYARVETGLAPNVGGIMGLTFNNAAIINTDVNITNGTLIAEKTEEDSYDALGSTCGGIIGRLEHTGVIKDCTVTGNSLNIIAKSTGSSMYAGGLVGVDIGPFHKNVISLENSKFIGNGTSSITVELIRGNVENRSIYSGGIAGSTTYIMKNCSVSGVTIYNKGTDTGVTKAAVGKLAGRFATNTGGWTTGTYFTPNSTRGIINCTSSNVNIVIEDNNSGVVSQGEQYGTAE